VRGKIDLDASDIDLSEIARAVQLQVPLQGMLSMKARIDTRRRVQGDITLDLAGIGVGGPLPLASANLTLHLRQRTLVASLAASMPGAANLNFNANVRVPRNPLNLPRWMNLDRRALLSLDGSATMNASEFAALNEALPRSGRIEMRLKQEEGTQEVALDLKARKLRSSHFSELAELDLHLDLEATKITSTARASLGPKATAKLASTLRLRGPWFATDSYQSIDFNSIEALDLSTTELDVDALLRNIGMSVDTTGALAQARIIYAPGTRSFEMNAGATIPQGGPKEGRFAHSLTLHATVGERAMSADLIGSIDSREMVKAEGKFAMGWNELLTGTADLGDVPVSAGLVVTRLPMPALQEVLRTTAVAVETIASAPELSGTLSVQANLSGRLSTPEITANASLDDAVVAGVAFSRVAADGSLQDGTVDMNVVGVQVAGGELKLSAKTALNGRPSAAISAQVLANDFDLGFLHGFAPERAIRGLLTAKILAAGTNEHPVVSGSVTLKKGSFNPGAPFSMVKDAEIHASLLKDTIVVSGRLRSGRGSVRLDGAIGLVDSQPRDLELTIDTSKLPLATGPMNVRLDSRSQLVGTYQRGALKLALDIERATLHLPERFARSLHPIDLPDDVIVSDGKIGLKQPGSMPQVPIEIEIEIAIRSKSNMLVKGGEANALVGVSLDLELGKETQARGLVRVEQGWIELVGRRYQIQTATASFSGDLDPSLYVQLAHEFDAITLFIDVSGLASLPVVEFRSEPSIYDTAELLAFVLGANPDQRETDGRGVSQKAASVATGLIAARLSGIVTNATPLDLLRIDTDDSSAERVSLGKWITDKLLVAYRHRFTNDPGTNSDELVFEYRFLKRWLLEGFVGQQAIGADALWIHRFY
jgi:autotransporter translocation and assembly factor TamB